MDFVDILPPEISLKVFANLELNDILNCSIVCKAWYDVINTNCIWKSFWDSDIPPKECDDCADFDWTYGSPCKWKLHRMNYQRIVNNWKEERFKTFEIEGCSLDDISYDGKTLVVNNGPLDIYRIDNGNLSHIQTLGDREYDDCLSATNTSFITVFYKNVITVYEYNNDMYETSYYIYVKRNDEKLSCTQDPKEIDGSSPCDKKSCSLNDLIFIIGDTLFLFFSYFKVFYAWELKERRCLLQKKTNVGNMFGEGNLVYYYQKNIIHVFDKKGENVMELKSLWNIDKIHCNRNIILAQREIYGELGLSAWHKKTGKPIFNRKIMGGGDFILHPKKEIIFILVKKDDVERDRFIAYNLLNGTILWKNLIRDYYFFYLYYIVAERFIIMNNSAYHLFKVYDSDSGKYLYSINDVDYDDLYATYDMLIYSRNMGKLILHIYS